MSSAEHAMQPAFGLRTAPFGLLAVFGTCAALFAAASAHAELDLAALQVTPLRGQSAQLARRDRYECHNWAVEQTGFVPQAAPVRESRDERDRRAERADRALRGAALGGAIGGLVRATQDKNPANGTLAGAAVGAAIGAATTPAAVRSTAVEDERDGDYLRALSACLEGRGYSVAAAASSGTKTAAAR